jgi:Transposase domain (DUF772)
VRTTVDSAGEIASRLAVQAFYSVRSERQLMEQLNYNLLFRWFVGLSLDAVVWDVTVLTKNRERLIAGDIAVQFMAAVLNQEQVKVLLSDEHFSVDGTLIEAGASTKGGHRRGRVGFHRPIGEFAAAVCGLYREATPAPVARLSRVLRKTFRREMPAG